MSYWLENAQKKQKKAEFNSSAKLNLLMLEI